MPGAAMGLFPGRGLDIGNWPTALGDKEADEKGVGLRCAWLMEGSIAGGEDREPGGMERLLIAEMDMSGLCCDFKNVSLFWCLFISASFRGALLFCFWVPESFWSFIRFDVCGIHRRA